MDKDKRVFEFEMISDNMVNIISEYSPKIKIAKKYKNSKVFENSALTEKQLDYYQEIEVSKGSGNITELEW